MPDVTAVWKYLFQVLQQSFAEEIVCICKTGNNVTPLRFKHTKTLPKMGLQIMNLLTIAHY